MYWNSLNDCLRRQYGCKVYKLALSSGCTCPNRDGTLDTRGCIFCDGSGAFAETGDIPAQLAAARRRVAAKAGRDPRFIAYFQSFTNTYAPVERLRALYTAAMAPEDVVVLSVATRPDCLPPGTVELLAELNREKPVWVELGLQTIHPASAAYIRRGYDLPVFDRAVHRLKEAGKIPIVHMDLITGLSSKEVSVDYIKDTTRADGIITTKPLLVKRAKELELLAIQRFFIIDSIALNNTRRQIETCCPDCVEIMPGVMPKILKIVHDFAGVPVIAGGLLTDKKDVIAALSSGADAVSTTNSSLWRI